MLLPVGGDTELNTDDIVGIFDLENGVSASVRAFLDKNRQCLTVVETLGGTHDVTAAPVAPVAPDTPVTPGTRSMVVTSDSIYLSPISTNTLRRRIEHDARIYG